MFNVQTPFNIVKKSANIYGREIYILEQNQQIFYLKTQKPHHLIFMQGFQNEIQVYTSLKNTHIVLPSQVIDLTCMPQLNLSGQGVLLPQAQPIVIAESHIKEILQVMAHLHHLGWVHGDLKPQHFVMYQNQIKLIDFEQTYLSNQTLTQTHATPRYMAPELFHAEKKTIQTDLYALGIIFYEALTKTRLKAKTYYNWAVLHCQTPLQLPTTYKNVLDGLLKKQKSERFLTALDALHALKNE